jgi:hypothetical protein
LSKTAALEIKGVQEGIPTFHPDKRVDSKGSAAEEFKKNWVKRSVLSKPLIRQSTT